MLEWREVADEDEDPDDEVTWWFAELGNGWNLNVERLDMRSGESRCGKFQVCTDDGHFCDLVIKEVDLDTEDLDVAKAAIVDLTMAYLKDKIGELETALCELRGG